jgi:hypothetical protein
MANDKHHNAPGWEIFPPGEREWWLLVGLYWLTIVVGSGAIWAFS